jgi:glycosyltransferase 2 family protein
MRPAQPLVRLLLRFAITLALGAVLAVKIDVRGTLAILARIGGGAFTVAVVLFALSALLAVPRWRLVLQCCDVAESLPRLTQLYLIGNFFNQILPSSVGGDAVRIWYLKRRGVALSVATRSVILDRLFGFAGMIGFVSLGLPVMLNAPSDEHLRRILIGAVAAFIALLVAFAFIPRLRIALGHLWPFTFLFELAGDFRGILRRDALLPCILLTIATNLLPVMAAAVLGSSLAIPLNILSYGVIVPAALIISLVPVSIAGWGVREAAMVVCMAPYGVLPETALALSIAFGIALMVSALPGGLLWFLRPPASAQNRQASLHE